MKHHLKNVLFNRNEIVEAGCMEQPDNPEIARTPSLWCASPEDAFLYGGDLTRAAMGAANLRNDRKYVVVDTKVHMLFPRFWPAIPGWHTDGAPRDSSLCPTASGPPDLEAQEAVDRPPRYHLLVTGEGCRTEFLRTPVSLEIPSDPSTELYAWITRDVNAQLSSGSIDLASIWTVPTCTMVEWDWWQLHRAIQATVREWRFLIRITETDFLPPERDLRRVLRKQAQVYAPADFGW